MIAKRIAVAVLGVVVAVSPSLVRAQMDPGSMAGSSSSPSAPGLNPSNGANTQPSGTRGAQPNRPSSMHDSLGAPGETGQQMLDQQFVRAAAEGGVADVKLGTLAVQKGSPAVRDLAQKLVDDHQAMNHELASVADAMGVMLPTKMSKDQQTEYDKLSALSGKDFDTEYVTYTAKAHYQGLHSYHMEASVAADPELATQVVKDMGTMHRHLGLVTDLAKQEGIALPPRPQRPGQATAVAAPAPGAAK